MKNWKLLGCLMLVSILLGGPALYAQLPAAGSDRTESMVEMTVQLDANRRTGAGPVEFNLVLTGPTIVHRGNPQPIRRGDYQIPTEIVSMDLTGTDPVAGTGRGGFKARLIQNPAMKSAGEIRTSGGSVAGAQSFFDIFVQMDIGGVQMFNRDPIHLAATINAIPPIETRYSYSATPRAVELFEGNTSIGSVLVMSDVLFPKWTHPIDSAMLIDFPLNPALLVPFPIPLGFCNLVGPGIVTIDGKVVDSSGSPSAGIPNVQVIAVKSTKNMTPLGALSSATTDANGSYSLCVPKNSSGYLAVLPQGCTMAKFVDPKFPPPCQPYCLQSPYPDSKNGLNGIFNPIPKDETFNFMLGCQ